MGAKLELSNHLIRRKGSRHSQNLSLRFRISP
jgi:hypothetical protein